jgi:pantothenate kinase-related protein Tda10
MNITKSQSMMVPPHTQKIHGKRLFSPLANAKKLQEKTEYRRPYVIGICGGPSSGKSSVAKFLKNRLPNAVILNLIHFYKPIRGNLRRRSRANSMMEDTEKGEEELKSEIRDVYRKNDFDSPDAIDW